MLDHLISANKSVKDLIHKCKLDEKDIDFIKELIMGKHLKNTLNLQCNALLFRLMAAGNVKDEMKENVFFMKFVA